MGSGLYLRRSNRYRWILIPRKLDGYESIKRELQMAGAPIMTTSIPANIEEFLFGLMFVGTIICAFAVHNLRVLRVNLIISLWLGFCGLYFIHRSPDAMAHLRMRWVRLGAFLPAAFAALGLWLAFRSYWYTLGDRGSYLQEGCLEILRSGSHPCEVATSLWLHQKYTQHCGGLNLQALHWRSPLLAG